MGGRRDCFGAVGSSFRARRWLSLDPCGILGVTFSFGVHVFAGITSGLYLLNDSLLSQVLYGGVYLPLAGMAVWSLYKAWRTDPGAVPMGARPLMTVRKAGSTDQPERAIRRCHKCNDNFKPARAHHDSITGRCIVKFDHFCPWVGNAVGALNHKFFCLFIGYTLITCMTTLALFTVQFFNCRAMKTIYNSDTHVSENEEATWHEPESKKAGEARFLGIDPTHTDCSKVFLGNPMVVILAITAVTFLIFTFVMLLDQLEAIQSNTSKIARMKLRVGQGGTELERVSHDFNEMFGGASPNPAWHWFVPISVNFPSGMEKVVLGYEWDPTFGDSPFEEDDLVAAIKGEKSTVHIDAGVDEESQDASEIENDSLSGRKTVEMTSGKISVSRAKKRVSTKKQDEVTFIETKNRLT